MHPLDLLLFLLLIAWPLARLLGWHRSQLLAMGFALTVVLGLPFYLAFGLLRWPVAPGLLMLIIWEVQAVSIMVGDVPPPPRTRRARYLSFAAALLLVALVAALPAGLLPRTPPFVPTGTFLAGVVDVTWPDTTRSDTAGGPYLLPVRLWFPAEPAPKPRRAKRHRAMAAFESDLATLLPGQPGPWIVRGLTRAPIPIFADMRLATRQRSYPVVILSHGAPGSPALLATLATELASNGYVVAAPEHLGASLGSVLPDDRYVPIRVTDLEPRVAAPEWAARAAADGRAVVAGLRMLMEDDSAGRFTGRLQLNEVAWVGQGSGALAGAALAAEGMISALVALDPTEDVSSPEQEAAVLVVGRDGNGPRSGSGDAVFRVEMPSAGMADFNDLAWWSPPLLRRAGLGGQLSARVAQDAVHRLTVSFLGAWTRHEPANLRGLVDSLPGVHLAGPQPAG
ncbi:MAG: hypothetical protein ABR551_05755 [Gemmatimonadales bacterium]